jgi:hypothetical protein
MKREMKQTAVEWLIGEIELGLSHKGMKSAFHKAKELEKQQMFEFWNKGIDCTEEGGKSFDQYYNETFNK